MPFSDPVHQSGVEALQPGAGLALRALRLLVLGLLFVPAIYWRGGVLETEAPWFISHYLDYRGVVEKVFDPYTNDFGSYQGRELSYFFDFLDAQVFRISLQIGYPLFIATSTFLATVALVLVHQLWVGRVLPRLNPITSILVLLTYLSGFVRISTDGMYYRSTKPLMAPLIVLGISLIWYFQQQHSRDGAARRSAWLVVGSLFLIGTTISLLDRMGFYLVTVALVLTTLHALWRRGRWGVCSALFAASAMGLLYNYVLGPQLIYWINGYRPDFTYQRVDLTRIVTEPRHLVQGWLLLVEQVWLCWGNYALLLVLLLAGVFGFRSLRMRPRALSLAWKEVRPWALYVLLACIAGSIMFAVMLIRHPAIYDVDHRLWYYGIPTQAALLFPALVFLNWLLAGAAPRRVRFVNVLLVCLVASNVMSWSRYQREMFTGEWYPVSYRQTAVLRRSLQREAPDPELSGYYVMFYSVCVLFENSHRVTGEHVVPSSMPPSRREPRNAPAPRN